MKKKFQNLQRKYAETESEEEAGADREPTLKRERELQSQRMCGAAMGQKEVSHSPAAD